MKLISTTDCKDYYVNFRSLDLSTICYTAIPKRSESGDFLPKIFYSSPTTSYGRSLDPEWYKISLSLRTQTRFSFIYETLPYVLQALKITPQSLSKYIEPMLLIKSIQEEIISNGITLITQNALVKFTVSFIRMIIRKKVKNKESTKTPEEQDTIANSYLEKISPLLLPSCVLPQISLRGECFIPSPSEIIAEMETYYDY